MARNMSLDEVMKNLGVMPKTIEKELDKATKEDAEYLKTKIYEHFDEVAPNTPIKGYYLEGRGQVLPYHNTEVFEGEYYKKWKKPLINIRNAKNGANLELIGTDAKILEYGFSPLVFPSQWWVHNTNEGYYMARNRYESGNWYSAIWLSTGNNDPLVSIGDKGTRFFAKYSLPTMFVRKACQEYEKNVKNNDTSVHLSANGIKVMIEKELNK